MGGVLLEGASDDLPRLCVGGLADDALDPGDGERAHRQLVQPQAQQDQDVARVARHLTAHHDGDPRGVPRLGDLLDHPQVGRMERLIQVRHVLVHPVHGQRVLDQVVRPDAEEVHLARQDIADHGGAGRLHHDPERYRRVVGFPPLVQIRLHLLDDLFRALNLFHIRDHGKHDARAAVHARAQDPGELPLEERALLEAEADGPESERRVRFGGEIQGAR